MKNPTLQTHLSRYGRLALLFLAFGCATSAHAWWDSDWTIRKSITLDTTSAGANLGEPVESATILLRLSDANFKFASAQADGSDIRLVAADDKTPLPYHIESIDPVLDVAFVWVKVSELKAAQKNQIWLYYGYRGNKLTKAEDPKGTYDSDTSLVFHFTEHGQAAFDSSGNGNTTSAPMSPDDGSIIGIGARLMGHDAASIPASATLATTDGSSFTWSAWIKPADLKGSEVIFSRREPGRGFVVGVDNGVPYVDVIDAGGAHRSPAGAPIAVGAWHYLTVVAGNHRVSLYLDQDPYEAFDASIPQLAGSAELGGDAVSAGFNGSIDELQISKVARTATQIRLAAFSQGGETADRFAAFGPDEQQKSWLSGFKTGYVGIIIGSLSIDGWVVIGILGVMSAISWIIMIKKAQFVKRVVKGNSQFIEAWRHVANDLSVLDSDDVSDIPSMGGLLDNSTRSSMHDSPLFRIYHIGVEEIRHRLASDQTGAYKTISARSIQAIRASLDGGLVRETQALNRNMVLLTIAISGGPFLGLLGTVVGVMITFAAVAAAGDVNVNAIAPGIAAALAATVAGLAVAIPALFGYNYLLTQIKSATADIHVFIEEFVTKLAEFYSEPVS